MTLLAKVALFLSSFAPLFLLLGIRHGTNIPVAAFFVGVSLIFGVGGLALVEWFGRTTDDTFVVERVENRAESLTGYLIGYLFPFLVLDPNDIYAVAANIGFGVFLAILYVQGNLLFLNPVLAIRGWRVWTVEAYRLDKTDDRRTLTVIIRSGVLEPTDKIATSDFAGDVRIARIAQVEPSV